MEKKIFLKQFIAVGLKTSSSASAYGDGHNFWVEAGFPLPLDLRAREAFKATLDAFDHRALGVDLDLGFEPTTENLCLEIAKRLRNQLGIEVQVILRRGDGLRAETVS